MSFHLIRPYRVIAAVAIEKLKCFNPSITARRILAAKPQTPENTILRYEMENLDLFPGFWFPVDWDMAQFMAPREKKLASGLGAHQSASVIGRTIILS